MGFVDGLVCSWWDGFRCLYCWWFVLWSKWCFVLHEENDGFFTRFMISYTPKYCPPISPWKPFHVENPKNGMDLLCQVVWLLQRNWLVPHPSGYLVAILTLLKLDSNTCSTFGAPFTDVNRWKKNHRPRPQTTYNWAMQKTLLLSSILVVYTLHDWVVL